MQLVCVSGYYVKHQTYIMQMQSQRNPQSCFYTFTCANGTTHENCIYCGIPSRRKSGRNCWWSLQVSPLKSHPHKKKAGRGSQGPQSPPPHWRCCGKSDINITINQHRPLQKVQTVWTGFQSYSYEGPLFTVFSILSHRPPFDEI